MRRVAARGAATGSNGEATFFARVRAGYLALAQAEPERLRFDDQRSGAGARDWAAGLAARAMQPG